MKKRVFVFTVLLICLSTFGTHKLIMALNLFDTVEITGNNLLPGLFYEHNLYNHKTEYGDIIYCLDPDKVGTEVSAYKGVVTNKLDFYSNQQIAILSSAIINGYPNTLPGNPIRYFTSEEYHTISSMAIRALCMEFKGMTKGKTAQDYVSVQYGDESAKLECIKLIEYAKSNPFNETYNELSVKCLSKNSIVSDDGSMISKEYIVESKNISGPLKISTKDNYNLILPQNLMVGQKFNIMILKDKTYESINTKGTISCKANRGLVYIKAGLSNRQNYIGILKVNQDIETNFDLNFESNIAKLKIFKKDIDTQEILNRASFKLWSKKPIDTNDDKNLIGIFETNAEGFIEVNNLGELGTYYIHELDAPVGYENIISGNFESIEIDKFGESYNKTIFNQQNILLENFIQIKGYKQVASNQEVEYKVYGATNASNVSLDNFIIKIPIPNEYYELNRKITIGNFEEKQGYLMYVKDSDNKSYEIRKPYKDEVNYHLASTTASQTRNIEGVFNSTDSEIIKVADSNIKELEIKLSPGSKGVEFKTPVFGNGSYSIYIKDMEKEYLLGSNYDGNKVNNFTCSDLRSYRIKFDKPIHIKEFKSGSFSTDIKTNQVYNLVIDTDRREGILIKENLDAKEINTIRIADIINDNLLIEGEIIKNISVIFNNPVKPGWSLTSPIIITGTSKDLQSISYYKFNGNRNNLYYSNTVEMYGEYKGTKVKNEDNWDTGSYSKDLKLTKGKLPRTGSYRFLAIGFIPITVGFFLITRWRANNE
jgi:hypothetical protein